MRIIVVAALFAVIGALQGCAHFENKPASDYDALRAARLFSIGRITDAGVFSEAEKAFRAILEKPGGSAQFFSASFPPRRRKVSSMASLD